MKNILILVFGITALSLFAQSAPGKYNLPESVSDLRNYKEFNWMRSFNIDSVKANQRNNYFDHLAVLNSFYGNFDKAEEYNLGGGDIEFNIDSLISLGYKPISIEGIFDQVAKDNKIIILNDAHPIAQTRVTLTRVLDLLYKQGFRYLAMETLDEKDTAINTRKFPIIDKTGYYSNEPCFGDLVRQSLKIGFKLVAYENNDPGIDRHLGQAMNIYNRIFKLDADAKVIIYSGNFNGITPEIGTGHGQMGYYLSKLTKTKPIFINQVSTYKYSSYKFPFSIMPFGLKSNTNYIHSNYTDLNLFIPFCEECDKQDPDHSWLKYNDRNREIIFKDKPKNLKYPYLIKVLFVDEGDDSVPLQQIEVVNDKTPIKYILYKGKYKVKCVDVDNVVFYEKELNVE